MDIWILKDEHVLLGGTCDSETRIACYPTDSSAASLIATHPVISDWSALKYFSVSGRDAVAFCTALCAHVPTSVGCVTQSAVYSGDGRLLATPLVARTGDSEFVLFDPTDRAETLYSWMNFLAQATDHTNQNLFDVSISNASGTFVPLVLSGANIRSIVEDYFNDKSTLKQSGSIAPVNFDALYTLTMRMPHELESYLVLILPQHARILWRSLLSFKEVVPLGFEALLDVFVNKHVLFDVDSNIFDMTAIKLVEHKLINPNQEFIGKRCLDDLDN